MEGTFSIAILRQSTGMMLLNFFVLIPCIFGVMLPIAKLLVPPLTRAFSRNLAIPPMIATGLILFFTAAYFAMVRAQGKIMIRDGRLTASMFLRQDRHFDLATTRISVEPFQTPLPGESSGWAPGGSALMFLDGAQQFIVGAYDAPLGQFLVDRGLKLQSEPPMTTVPNLLKLAEFLDIDVPRPPGWRLDPRPGL